MLEPLVLVASCLFFGFTLACLLTALDNAGAERREAESRVLPVYRLPPEYKRAA
jgi:hypothetical protein